MKTQHITLNSAGAGYSAAATKMDDLKTILAENATASFESSDFGGMQSVAPQLGNFFEGSKYSPESSKNAAGLAMASYVAGLGDGAKGYMTDYSVESGVSAGDAAFSVEGGFESVYSPESFDNQVLNKWKNFSVLLNYNIGRQGDAMELMYRTVAITPDQSGFKIDVPNLFVQNVLERSLNGNPTDWKYRRAIDAYIDPGILADDGIQLIPNYTTETAAHFVATGVAAQWNEVQGSRTVKTGFLKVGREVDLTAIGHLDKVERIGSPDFTDALDRSIGIDRLLHVVDGQSIQWTVKGQPFSRFVPSTEQGARRMILDYVTRGLVLTADAVNIEGDALTGAWYDLIVAQKLRVHLKLTSSGSVELEHGKATVNPASITVAQILDQNNKEVDLTDATFTPILEAIEGSKIEGWYPDARVTNSNVRHIGILIAHRATKEIFVTRTRAPFFYAYPTNEERDTTPAENLSAIVHAYINNEGIAHMKGFFERAMQQTGGVRGLMTEGNFEDNHLTIEGIARHLINPYIAQIPMDLTQLTQSTQTANNLANAKEALINRLRAVAFDILQKTNIENAARILDGGELKHKLKFVIVTSKEIESFLSVNGDSRTLGAGLDYEIVSDINQDLVGKMYMGIVRETNGNEIDVLSNGICLQTPTMVTEVTSWRNNRQTKELLVQPRFNHYQLLPIMVRFDVEGVREIMEQLLPFSLSGGAGLGGFVTP